tara:strand:+ start:466 stop:687 length:222 start_codon:yes stop_codon:yes gene_type:complete
MILQEVEFPMLVVAVVVEDRQMVPHVELVVLEEIQVDQLQEMLELQERLTEAVVVVPGLLEVVELVLRVVQEL